MFIEFICLIMNNNFFILYFSIIFLHVRIISIFSYGI